MLNLTSLREQVYRYLRREMQKGKLLPESSINIGELSRELGISKPLRDAHWSFSKHERYIRRFYANVAREIDPELAQLAVRSSERKRPRNGPRRLPGEKPPPRRAVSGSESKFR